jgi:hypothetical protein
VERIDSVGLKMVMWANAKKKNNFDHRFLRPGELKNGKHHSLYGARDTSTCRCPRNLHVRGRDLDGKTGSSAGLGPYMGQLPWT